jgi:hypothetical protein
LTDVPDNQGAYGVPVAFASAPPGGSTKTITVDQIKITAKDAKGVSPDALATINTPTDISLVHVLASSFGSICSGKLSENDGRVDFTWSDLTKFVRNGRITLTKYGFTSPGIQRVLYDAGFEGTPSEYGPNRISIPINLFPAGIFVPSSLVWDINNPLSEDPLAPWWVAEGDLLTLTILTSADGDPETVLSEYTFEFHHELDLFLLIEPATVGVAYSQVVSVIPDPYWPVPSNPVILYVSGLPAGGFYNSGTFTITGTFSVAGTYNVIFDVISEGGKTNRETIQLIVAPTSGTKPVVTSLPTFTADTAKTNSYLITTDIPATRCRATNLPDGLFVGFGRQIIGTPTVLPGTYPVTLQAMNSNGWGTTFALALTVIEPAPEIFSPSSVDAIVGEEFFYQILASGSALGGFYFAADGLPEGLECDHFNGIISGKPLAIQQAYQQDLPETFVADDPKTFDLQHTVMISAMNRAGGAGTMELALNVKLPDVPVIDVSALSGRAISLNVNESFVFQPSASHHPTRWTADPLSTGLSFDSVNGRLSGQFITSGFYGITFVAINAGGESDAVTFNFMVGVAATGGGEPPPISRVPIDVVDLWVDLDTGFVSVGSASQSEAKMTVKRGDSTITNIIFHKTGIPQNIDLNALYFGAKVSFDEEYVVYSTAFTRVTDGRYKTYPDFSDQNNELDSIMVTEKAELIGEIQWDLTDGTRRSTQTFGMIVLRDLLHPDPAGDLGSSGP